MITITKAHKRYFHDIGTMQIHSLFSFSDIYDSENLCFGDIFVFKDYLTRPGHGFGMHPHEDFEIILIYLTGETLYQDSLGNDILSSAGRVHHISAGTGHAHKITNAGTEACRYVSIWMRPKLEGLAPSHNSRQFDPQSWQNKLFLLISDSLPPVLDEENNGLAFNGRGAIYRCELGAKPLTVFLGENKLALLYVLDGDILLNEESLVAGDHARMIAEKEFCVQGTPCGDFLLITTPEGS